MKKKGFTLVELLVVIAIIAMLLAILMPALGKVRQLAYRLMCGTNQAGLGKAMMVYSNENDETFPRSGVSDSVWANTATASETLGWQWDKADAFTGTTAVPAKAKATISSSLYLLIKYADVSGAQFVCQASDQKKFELETAAAKASEQNYSNLAKDLTECWDFGTMKAGTVPLGPWNYVSYSYQVPWSSYVTGVSSPAGVGLMSDKSPYYDSTTLVADLTTFLAINTTADLDKSDIMKKGNARAHQSEGQNVLYGDGHVSFEKMSNVGVEQDNIYTMWKKTTTPIAEVDKQIGADPRTKTPGTVNTSTNTTPVGCAPMATDDTFLVNDGPKI